VSQVNKVLWNGKPGLLELDSFRFGLSLWMYCRCGIAKNVEDSYLALILHGAGESMRGEKWSNSLA
jgi:hypothetical protein